jgi:hypothetical protein
MSPDSEISPEAFEVETRMTEGRAFDPGHSSHFLPPRCETGALPRDFARGGPTICAGNSISVFDSWWAKSALHLLTGWKRNFFSNSGPPHARHSTSKRDSSLFGGLAA